MEPFTIRCETCKAKLRVRDERVLGQIHECPRCHSMVLIAAPGAAAFEAKMQAVGPTLESVAFPATATVAPEPMPAEVVAAAVEPPPIETPTAAADWSRIILWAAGGAALFITGSIVGAIALRGGEEQVAATPEPRAIATTEVEVSPAEVEAVATTPEVTIVEPAVPEDVVAPPPAEVEAKTQAEVETQALVAAAPQEAPVVVVEAPKPERTLTLEPVKPAATMGDIAAQLEAPDYEEIVPEVVAPVEAKTQAVVDAGRVTNVRQQLSLPIAAMEINALPFASFIEMISEMAAVRIAVDADTLKAAGVTPRTKVRVAGREETIESLLTAVLEQHHLTWEERDGRIVIVLAR